MDHGLAAPRGVPKERVREEDEVGVSVSDVPVLQKEKAEAKQQLKKEMGFGASRWAPETEAGVEEETAAEPCLDASR